MHMPFQEMNVPNGEGKKAQLCILDADNIKNAAGLAYTSVHIQSGYSIGLLLEGRCIAALLARPSTQENLADGIVLWLDQIFVAEDVMDGQMEILLLRAADAIWQQQEVIKVWSNIAEKRQMDALLSCGFSRMPYDQVSEAGQYAWLQKGIGVHYVPRALLLIDYTYDFVAPDGKLTTGEAGQAIEGALVRQIQLAIENGDEIIAMNDVHEMEDFAHPERALFPPHNMRDTSGRDLFGRVAYAFEEAKAMADDRVHEWEKTRYSAFWDTPLLEYLQKKRVPCVILTGVCTDICVMHTAVDAYNRGYRIIVPEKAVASFDADGHAAALRHMKNSMGADLISRAYVEEEDG